MKKDYRLNVRINEDVHNELRDLLKARPAKEGEKRETISSVIVAALNRKLSSEKTLAKLRS